MVDDPQLAASEERALESSLEACLRRPACSDIVRLSASILAAVRRGKAGPGHWPAFAMARIVEASCAYHRRGHGARPATENDLRKARNIVVNVGSAHQRRMLEQGEIEAFGRVMARTQLELQPVQAGPALLRAVWMLSPDALDQRLLNAFRESSGLSIERYMLFLVMGRLFARSQSLPTLTIADGEQLDVQSGWRRDWETFLHLVSWDQDELGQRYLEDRDRRVRNPLLWSTIRSLLLEKPGVRVSHGEVVFPIPDLLARMAFRPVLGHVASAGEFGQKHLAKRFELYTGELVKSSLGVVVLQRPSDGSGSGSGRQADWVFGAGSDVLVIECKHVESSLEFLGVGNWHNDTVFRRIAEGIEQVLASIQRAMDDCTGESVGMGFVVVASELPFVAGPGFWEKVVLRHAPGVAAKWDRLAARCRIRPMAVSIETFQLLVAASMGTLKGMGEVLSDWQAEHERTRCDLSTYFEHRAEVSRPVELPILRDLRTRLEASRQGALLKHVQ